MLTKEQFDYLSPGDHVIVDVPALAEVSQRYADAGCDFVLRTDSDVCYSEKLDAVGRYAEGWGTWFTTLYSGDTAIVQHAFTDYVRPLDSNGIDEEIKLVVIADNENAKYLTLVEEEACAALTLV